MEYYKSHYETTFPLLRFDLHEDARRGLCLRWIGDQGDKFYDPFDHLAESKRRDDPPPYIEFANLNPDDPEALCQYANTRGIPPYPLGDYREDVTTQRVPPKVQRDGTLVFRLTARDLRLPPTLYPVSKFAVEVRKFHAVLGLRALLSEEHPHDVSDRAARLIAEAGLKVPEWRRQPFPSRDTRLARYQIADALVAAITFPLRGAYPDLRSMKNEAGRLTFTRRLRVKDFRQAIYATLYEDLVLLILVCADLEKCGRYFVQSHKGKMFCTPECARRVSRRNTYRRQVAARRLSKEARHGTTRRKEPRHR